MKRIVRWIFWPTFLFFTLSMIVGLLIPILYGK